MKNKQEQKEKILKSYIARQEPTPVTVVHRLPTEVVKCIIILYPS